MSWQRVRRPLAAFGILLALPAALLVGEALALAVWIRLVVGGLGVFAVWAGLATDGV